MENKEYLKFKVGDYVEVINRDKKGLNDKVYNFLTSKPFHIIKSIEYDERIEDETVKLSRPYICLGFKNPMSGDEYKFPAYRFKLFDKSKIDPDDPYGEEIYEKGYKFKENLNIKELEAFEYINENIGKMWITTKELNRVCRIVSIEENSNKNVYNIKYVFYKEKGNIQEIPGAREFLSYFNVFVSGMIGALQKQINIYEKQHVLSIEKLEKEYETLLQNLRETINQKRDKINETLNNKIKNIEELIEIAKKQ
jgi:hypothetical protein